MAMYGDANASSWQQSDYIDGGIEAGGRAGDGAGYDHCDDGVGYARCDDGVGDPGDGYAVGYADGEDCYLVAPDGQRHQNATGSAGQWNGPEDAPEWMNREEWDARHEPGAARDVTDDGLASGIWRGPGAPGLSRALTELVPVGGEQGGGRPRAASGACSKAADGGRSRSVPGENDGAAAAGIGGVPARSSGGRMSRRPAVSPPIDPVTAILAQSVLSDEASLRKSRAGRRRRYIAITAAVCALGFILVYQYSALVGHESMADSRRAYLSEIVRSNALVRDEIEKNIDIENIKLRAESLYGMFMPDKSHFIYIAVPRRDHAVVAEKAPARSDAGLLDLAKEQWELFVDRITGRSAGVTD